MVASWSRGCQYPVDKVASFVIVPQQVPPTGGAPTRLQQAVMVAREAQAVAVGMESDPGFLKCE